MTLGGLIIIPSFYKFSVMYYVYQKLRKLVSIYNRSVPYISYKSASFFQFSKYKKIRNIQGGPKK